MTKEAIQKRLDYLKTENDRAAEHLQRLDSERQKSINDILTRNGRILELSEFLKED